MGREPSIIGRTEAAINYRLEGVRTMWLDDMTEAASGTPFFCIPDLAPAPVYVKCEALNIAGSIKLKPALRMVDGFVRRGLLSKTGTLIESSSGNLGVALSMVAAAKGYRFICVTDPNASEDSIKIMRAVGAEVIVVEEKDQNGGFLGSRIKLITSMCRNDNSLLWVNQYANEDNWISHYTSTAPEILERYPKVDKLFIGAGTGGTLMGCARYFRSFSPATHVVAVDVVGSITFGAPPGSRRIPGLGTSRRPEIIDDDFVSSVVHVTEQDTIAMCRRFAKRGLLLGGSTGSVLAGVAQACSIVQPDDVVVTIMPDMGFKYVDTIYNDEWAGKT